MYPASTKAADGLPRRAFSADDISRMIQAGILCESERIELIEGDIVVLEPKPSGQIHQERVGHDVPPRRSGRS